MKCPNCGSENTKVRYVLLGMRTVYDCNSCSKSWIHKAR